MGIQDKLHLGNLNAYRDWGFAGDYVNAMWMMLQQNEPDDYVISTGRTIQVREFLNHVFDYSGLGDPEKYVEFDDRLFRPHEVPYLLGDCTKAREKLGWKPEVSLEQLAQMMYDSDYKEIGGVA